MGLFRDLSQLPETAKGGVLVIGNFDGVHKGHQAVLSRALEKAQEIEGETKTEITVLVFDPHPRQYFAPHAPSLRTDATGDTRAATRTIWRNQYSGINI
jgi:riboflavin kinase/FMN adenylyltransferase